MLKLLRHLKVFRWAIIISVTMTMLRSMAELSLPTLSADLVNIGIVNGDIPYIWRIGLRMLLFATIGVAAFILSSYLASKVSAGFARLLREKIFTHVENFSLHEFNRFGTASLINRTTNDITQIQGFLEYGLRMMVTAPTMCLGSIALAFYRDATLALVFVAISPLIIVLIFLISRKAFPLFESIQTRLDSLNLIVRELLTGMRVIRAFNREKYEQSRFQAANHGYAITSIRVNRMMGAMWPLMSLVINMTIISIVWFGGIRVDLGYTNVGDLMAFIQYAMHVVFSFMIITMMFVMIPRAAVSANRINEVLDTATKIKDAANPREADKKEGRVEFKNVTFSYPGAERPVLSDISFCAAPGEIIGIIGSTGSGKSTLMNLMLRFYDIEKGSILIDGIDIREMELEHLRAMIGYVPQKAVLFSGTVQENIRHGKENAHEDEISWAAKIAQAAGFISHMQEGFSSWLAQGGKNISGGQKQRLSIARALVRKPFIYIFDDIFSALDYKTEARLRQSLYKEVVDSTVFIVSQRVGTIKNASRIIVLEEGRIAGIGSHSALLDECAVYREIVASQLSEEETA
ncbi:MAG: ABC transporter ATP-binding protein [Firmicutes bacterium]|nr:ABC transporter ATP-binding protein [Bacillota bacterium]